MPHLVAEVEVAAVPVVTAVVTAVVLPVRVALRCAFIGRKVRSLAPYSEAYNVNCNFVVIERFEPLIETQAHTNPCNFDLSSNPNPNQVICGKRARLK